MDKTIFVLGSKGMLGQMVNRYFSKKGIKVVCFDTRFDYSNRTEYKKFLSSIKSGYVINCIGKIKQKSNDLYDLMNANAILPAELKNCLREEIVLIHPSTDCVFDGKGHRPYSKDDEANAEDEYGWSKRLGEVVLEGRPNTLVPRVSIIGPDNNPDGKGLFTWVKSNPPGSTIKGFTNHLWNGITTLEWCIQIEKFLDENVAFPFRLLQYGTSEFYTKYEMLNLFNTIYKLNLQIEPVSATDSIDRRLIANVISKSLPDQLIEMAKF